LSPFVGIAILLAIASVSDLPDTETLANPKTNLATEVYTADDKLLAGITVRTGLILDLKTFQPIL